MTIKVVEPGLLTTVQDLGRWGSQALGVPVSGPMDGVSHRLANLLVGNQSDCATLEVTLVGPTVAFLVDTIFAVAGAEFELWLDGKRIPRYATHYGSRGSCLRFGTREAGARAYLAVGGGIDVPEVLGSRSTDLASGLGGLEGRPLRGGDLLEVGRTVQEYVPRVSSGVPFPLPKCGAVVRVISGHDEDRFGPDIMGVFGDARFTIGPESSRMGYRLQGQALKSLETKPLLSSATHHGTVQVTPSGELILLMADRQTTGGYPKIAGVISSDLPVAGQLAPGDWIEFEVCERREAVAALIRLEQVLMRL